MASSDPTAILCDAFGELFGLGATPRLMDAAMGLSRLLQRGRIWAEAPARLRELELAAVARARALRHEDEDIQAEAVIRLLCDEGFCGDVDDYENPANSFIDRVLERRRGVPLSLCVLAIHLAESAGIDLEGVAFPGHFIVGIGLQSATPSIFDPFNEGRRLSFGELAELYRSATGRAMTSSAPLLRDCLRAAPTRAIVSRMLRNLQRHYAQRGAQDRVVEVLGLLAVLHPDADGLRKLQGRLRSRLAELN
jgi:regulator of sirC expression with transglutaminase-like and TPR domain